MEEDKESLFSLLLRVDEAEGQQAWCSFLFDIPAARSLSALPSEEALKLLQAGHRYSGAGWTTSRASRTLHALTGIPLVASAVSAYRDAWLYALSMAWNVEVVGLDLTDRSAEASFALCSILCGAEEGAPETATCHRIAMSKKS